MTIRLGGLRIPTNIKTEHTSEASNTKSAGGVGRLLLSKVKDVANTVRKSTVAVRTSTVSVAKMYKAIGRDTVNAFKQFVSVHGGGTQRTEGKTSAAASAMPKMTKKQANVDKIINTLKEKIADSDVDIKGLFRKTGSIKDARKIGGSIDKKDIKPEKLETYSVHVLASVLKKEVKGIELLNGDDLRAMQQPGADKAGIIKDKIAGLPADKKAIIENFMDFIKSNTANARFVERSEMNSSNLAIVIAPNLLGEKAEESLSLDQLPMAHQMVTGAFKELIDGNDTPPSPPPRTSSLLQSSGGVSQPGVEHPPQRPESAPRYSLEKNVNKSPVPVPRTIPPQEAVQQQPIEKGLSLVERRIAELKNRGIG